MVVHPSQRRHYKSSIQHSNAIDVKNSCRRCGQKGHISSGCQNAQILFCWICGRRGIRTINCCRNGVKRSWERIELKPNGLQKKQTPSSESQTTGLQYVDNHICATILMGSMAFTATVDTGASASFVSQEVAHQLELQSERVDVNVGVTLANGSITTLRQAIQIIVRLGNFCERCQFIIMPTATDGVLLGIDFLQQAEALLSCGGNTITLCKASNVTSSDSCGENEDITPRKIRKLEPSERSVLPPNVLVGEHLKDSQSKLDDEPAPTGPWLSLSGEPFKDPVLRDINEFIHCAWQDRHDKQRRYFKVDIHGHRLVIQLCRTGKVRVTEFPAAIKEEVSDNTEMSPDMFTVIMEELPNIEDVSKNMDMFVVGEVSAIKEELPIAEVAATGSPPKVDQQNNLTGPWLSLSGEPFKDPVLSEIKKILSSALQSKHEKKRRTFKCNIHGHQLSFRIRRSGTVKVVEVPEYIKEEVGANPKVSSKKEEVLANEDVSAKGSMTIKEEESTTEEAAAVIKKETPANERMSPNGEGSVAANPNKIDAEDAPSGPWISLTGEPFEDPVLSEINKLVRSVWQTRRRGRLNFRRDIHGHQLSFRVSRRGLIRVVELPGAIKKVVENELLANTEVCANTEEVFVNKMSTIREVIAIKEASAIPETTVIRENTSAIEEVFPIGEVAINASPPMLDGQRPPTGPWLSLTGEPFTNPVLSEIQKLVDYAWQFRDKKKRHRFKCNIHGHKLAFTRSRSGVIRVVEVPIKKKSCANTEEQMALTENIVALKKEVSDNTAAAPSSEEVSDIDEVCAIMDAVAAIEEDICAIENEVFALDEESSAIKYEV